MSIDTITCGAFVLAMAVYIVYPWKEIKSLYNDIRDLNRIIKRLQAENGMRAEELREQVLAYGASMCKPVTPTKQYEHHTRECDKE